MIYEIVKEMGRSIYDELNYSYYSYAVGNPRLSSMNVSVLALKELLVT